jgi:hypothetical protein
MPQVDFTLEEVVSKVDERVKASEARMREHVTKSTQEIIDGTIQLVNTVLGAVEEVRKDVRGVDWKVANGVHRDEYLTLKGRVDELEGGLD